MLHSIRYLYQISYIQVDIDQPASGYGLSASLRIRVSEADFGSMYTAAEWNRSDFAVCGIRGKGANEVTETKKIMESPHAYSREFPRHEAKLTLPFRSIPRWCKLSIFVRSDTAIRWITASILRSAREWLTAGILPTYVHLIQYQIHYMVNG
jgi:hypothetical protein